MRQFVTLNTVLAFDDTHYLGGSFFTTIGGKEYSFVKGMLSFDPKKFQHPLYRTKWDQCACYLIRNIKTGKIYAGSSDESYKRVGKHKWAIRIKKHDNSVFTEVLKESEMNDFDLILFFTHDIEEALNVEQYFVNRFMASGVLINIAHDVRYAMLGRAQSPEHREKIRQSNLGKVFSEETKQKISISRKTSEKALKQLATVHDRKKRSVLVKGVAYSSISEASRVTGLSETAIRTAAETLNNVDTYFLKDSVSPLKNRPLSAEQRHAMSLARKSSPKAIAQLDALRAKARRSIILNGILYESVTEAVKATGVPESSIHKQLRKLGGKNPTGPYVLDYVRQR